MIVPVIITPPPEPSERARDLSELITQLVNDYLLEEPTTSDVDVNQALTLASQKLRSDNSMAATGILIMSTLVLGLCVLVALFFVSGYFNINKTVILPIVIGLMVAVLAIAVVFTKLRR